MPKNILFRLPAGSPHVRKHRADICAITRQTAANGTTYQKTFAFDVTICDPTAPSYTPSAATRLAALQDTMEDPLTDQAFSRHNYLLLYSIKATNMREQVKIAEYSVLCTALHINVIPSAFSTTGSPGVHVYRLSDHFDLSQHHIKALCSKVNFIASKWMSKSYLYFEKRLVQHSLMQSSIEHYSPSRESE